MIIHFGLESLEPLEKFLQRDPIVFTNGCFDLLHAGHVQYLQDAAKLGILIIGLNSDSSVKQLKGIKRPILSENERASILMGLKGVAAVIIFDEETPLKLIQTIKPQILVKGGDWPVEKIIGADFVLKSGGKVESLPFYEGHSSTEIVERVLERYQGS